MKYRVLVVVFLALIGLALSVLKSNFYILGAMLLLSFVLIVRVDESELS
jgi:hypothetical protein